MYVLLEFLVDFLLDTKKVYVKEKTSGQEFEPPTVPVSSPLTPTVLQNHAPPTCDAISTSVHLPFVFTSPPSSIPKSSSTLTCPASLCSSVSCNHISYPLISVNSGFGIMQSSELSSVSSVATHAPVSTSTTGEISTPPSLLNVASILEVVPKATLASQLVSTSVAKPLMSVTNASVPVTTSVTKILTPTTKIQMPVSVSTTKDSSGSKSSSAKSVSTTSSVHSSKVVATKKSVAAAGGAKKPKKSSAVVLHSSKTNLLHSLKKYYKVAEHRTISNLKIGYLCDVKQGTEMECVVPEVASPSEFWIQPVNYELIRLMKNME